MPGEPVGREPEIALMERFLERPAGGLSVALLVGDPGIGKSTLWQGAIDAACARSYAVLASRPAEIEHGLAYLVLGDLFRDVASSHLASLPGPQRRAFEAALLIGGKADASIDPRALGVAVTTVLRSMADERPVVIAIDDDQWMDAPSGASLMFAVRRLPDQPIRLLLSRRRHGHPAVALEGSVEGTTVEHVDLGPLSLGATQLLLRDRLRIALPRPTIRELHRVAGGNPFHALELGRARSSAAPRDLDLPIAGDTVDALLRARLRGFDDATTQAMLLVAAHGRTPAELLRRLDVSTGTIETAVDSGVLEWSGDKLGFTHPLLAAAVYGGARRDVRRAAHRRLAVAIEDDVQRARQIALGAAAPNASVAAELEAAVRIARERMQSVAAADLAEHAVRLTPAAATDDLHRRTVAAARARLDAGDGQRARAIVANLLDTAPVGARRAEILLVASELEPPATAVVLLEEALRNAGREPSLRARIHAALGAAGRLTRGRAWAERHVQASLRSARALGDGALRARAVSATALLRFEAAGPDPLDLALEAYRLSAEAQDEPSRREAALTVGHVLTWSGDTAGARSWFLDQLEMWRDRDEIMQSDCLWYLALVELRGGRWTIAAARAEEATDIRTRYGVEIPQDHLPAALIALHRGDFELARRRSERALALADGMLLPAHLAILATIELWTGDLTRAIIDFERAEDAADARGLDEPALREWRADYGEALLRVGRIDDAVRLMDQWEATATRLGRHRELAGVARVRGLRAAAVGDLGAAVRLLDDAAIRHAAAGDRFGAARSRLASGVAHRRLRHKRLARVALESAASTFVGLGATSWAADTRAELARLGGRERMEGMSPSERRVAELVAEGRTNRDIATVLFLSERTVASHLTHVYAKLGVRTRTELARIIVQGGSEVPTS